MKFLKTILLNLFLFYSFAIKAQLCTGSLGDPVAVIDFGSGPNPGPENYNVKSPYIYTNNDCPQEGFYAIRNSTFFCNDNGWLVVPYDHTNDVQGYFLLVNGLAGPSLVFQDTVSGLCPNITIQVDAYLMNLYKPSGCGGKAIDPNITFTITDMTGNLLGQTTTGPINEVPLQEWTSRSFAFTAPVNGSVILKITSNAAAGCGNDFAIDDITFRPCGPSISATFANYGLPLMAVCETDQQNVLMSESYNGNFANPAFQWQISSDYGSRWTNINGANNTSLIKPVTAPGEYWYRCTVADASLNGSAACRFPSNPLKVQVVGMPFAQATNYVFGCYGSTIYLFAAGGSTYEWFGPNGFHSNLEGPEIPNVSFSATGTYIVKVTTLTGCVGYDTTNLVIYEAPIATLTPVTVNFCEGDSVQLNAGGSLRYKWFPSTGLSNDTIPNPFAKPTDDVTYTVRVYNQYTCYDTASVSFIVWKKPKAFAGPDQYFRKNRPVQLTGNASGTNISYNWTPPTYLDNPNYLRPIAKPPATITYTLNVVSNYGCGIARDSVKLEAIDKLFIPTAFTPNNDGLNDIWEIVTFDEYEAAIVDVYNRYGQLIYRGYGKNYKPWDGTFKGQPARPGTYVYMLNLNNGKPILKGTLELIR